MDYYREVLKYDCTCVEAIACIGTHHFYNDQPEIALRFYRLVNDMEMCVWLGETHLYMVSIVFSPLYRNS